MNINLLLENSVRTCSIGENIFTKDRYEGRDKWGAPAFGLCGKFAIGHQLGPVDKTGELIDGDIIDPVTLEFTEGGRNLAFTVVRHRWTPAWQQTYYRSDADEKYARGLICVKEEKCFVENDVFRSDVEVFNDYTAPLTVGVKLSSVFGDGENQRVVCATKAWSLRRSIPVDSFAVLSSDLGRGTSFALTVPAKGSVRFSYVFAFSKNGFSEAKTFAENAFANVYPMKWSEDRFNSFFEENVPKLTTDDMELLKVYYYRWFMVWRGTHTPSLVLGDHHITRSCMYESPFGGWFGAPVGLSVPLQILEASWMRDTTAAYDQSMNWADELKGYGEFIEFSPFAIWKNLERNPNDDVMRYVYPTCRKLTLAEFDLKAEGIGFLPTVLGSPKTGAEYSPSFFQHTDPAWDWTQDNYSGGPGTVMYRLDHITFAILKLIACREMGKRLGLDGDVKEYSEMIDRAKKLVCDLFWNEERHSFVDVDAATEKQCDKAIGYECFFPYMYHVFEGDAEVFDHFEPTSGLECDFSITSVEKSCPMFWSDNCLTGPTKATPAEPHLYDCCWNGPVWPFAISGALEGFGAVGERDASVREKWLELFKKYNELHFLHGDRSLPALTEHYNSTDATSFRGHIDYFHSCWLELFYSFYAGIKHLPDGTVEFDPFTNAEFEIKGLYFGNEGYDFSQKYENGELVRKVKKIC